MRLVTWSNNKFKINFAVDYSLFWQILLKRRVYGGKWPSWRRTSAAWGLNMNCVWCWSHPTLVIFCPQPPYQGVTRSLFQFSRRKWEFLSFNLMIETRMRISFSQSRASRREREFRFPISGFETRTRIEIKTILARSFGNYFYCLNFDRFFLEKSS